MMSSSSSHQSFCSINQNLPPSTALHRSQGECFPVLDLDEQFLTYACVRLLEQVSGSISVPLFQVTISSLNGFIKLTLL
jgi:hypothetical protein